MLKTLYCALFSLSLLLSNATVAHEGEDHEHFDEFVTTKEAIEISLSAVQKMSTRDVGLPFGQLAESWQALGTSDAELHKKGDGYLIIAVNNDEEARSLFLLVSSMGEVYDANFTGQFEGLD